MKNLAILGVRFLALFALLRALMYLEFIPSILVDEYFSLSDSWHSFVVIGFYLLFSGFLFITSERVASFMIPELKDQDFQIDNYEKFSAVLFSSIGLLIIYWSIQSLFNSIASIVNMNMMYPDNPDMQEYRRLTIIFGGLIQVILGILLFIGGKKLAKWWYDFRNWT